MGSNTLFTDSNCSIWNGIQSFKSSRNRYYDLAFGTVDIFQFYTPSSIEAYGVGNPNGSLWTISMEIQIYILIMLLYGWLKRRNKKEWLILMAGYRMQCDFFVDEAIPSLNGI